MNEAPKRRWLQFNLRTLFVLITLIACWLGYELNWIRQRHDFITEETANCESLRQRGHKDVFTVSSVGPGKSPALLWLFGEPRLDYLAFVVESRMPADMRKALEKMNADSELDRQREAEASSGGAQSSGLTFTTGGFMPQVPLPSNYEKRLSLAQQLFPELPTIHTIDVMKDPFEHEQILIQPRAR